MAKAKCPNCDSVFAVDRDEDGIPRVPAVKCAESTCETYLCEAGCEHLSFVCECGERFCNEHGTPYGSIGMLCAVCLELVEDEDGVERRVPVVLV